MKRTQLKEKNTMHTYEIHFTIDGKAYFDQITTINSARAKELLKMRYPDAKITSIREV